MSDTSSKPEYFAHHEQDDERRFADLKNDTSEIKSDIKLMRENHLAHIQESIGKLETSYAKLGNDIRWFKWILGAIGMATFTQLLATLSQVIHITAQ